MIERQGGRQGTVRAPVNNVVYLIMKVEREYLEQIFKRICGLRNYVKNILGGLIYSYTDVYEEIE